MKYDVQLTQNTYGEVVKFGLSFAALMFAATWRHFLWRQFSNTIPSFLFVAPLPICTPTALVFNSNHYSATCTCTCTSLFAALVLSGFRCPSTCTAHRIGIFGKTCEHVVQARAGAAVTSGRGAPGSSGSRRGREGVEGRKICK